MYLEREREGERDIRIAIWAMANNIHMHYSGVARILDKGAKEIIAREAQAKIFIP